MTPAPAQAFIAAARVLVSVKEELGILDGVAGDGDLGASMAVGFTAVIGRLSEADGADQDVGALLTTMGSVLSTTAPSTLGTLLGLGFRRAGRELAGRDRLDADTIARMVDALVVEIALRGGAGPGDRTVLDALGPAAEAARAAADREDPPQVAADAAAKAAEQGAAGTQTMPARRGRAAWLKEHAYGSPDAGAMAAAYWIRGLADALAEGAVR